jgi:hypothetical protein
MKRHPSELKTKMKIFGQFLDFMGVCIKGDGNDKSQKENLAHLPYVHKWMRTNVDATVMHLDNGTILCPVKKAVSVSEPKAIRSYVCGSVSVVCSSV